MANRTLSSVFSDFDVSTAPHTVGGARVRVGSLTDHGHTSFLDRGGASAGHSAGEGLTSAHRARTGVMMSKRVSRAVSASRRRCSVAADARRLVRYVKIFGTFVGPIQKWHLSLEQAT